MFNCFSTQSVKASPESSSRIIQDLLREFCRPTSKSDIETNSNSKGSSKEGNVSPSGIVFLDINLLRSALYAIISALVSSGPKEVSSLSKTETKGDVDGNKEVGQDKNVDNEAKFKLGKMLVDNIWSLYVEWEPEEPLFEAENRAKNSSEQGEVKIPEWLKQMDKYCAQSTNQLVEIAKFLLVSNIGSISIIDHKGQYNSNYHFRNY